MSKPSKPGQSGQPRRQLNLFDTINIIIGVIIGSGIYETTPDIASNTSSSTELIGVWIFGGVIALIAAFCYVELTTSFPREGGDYVFLSKGLGRHFGFLFSWAEFWIIRPGNIGMMAFVFARFAREIVPLDVPAPWRNVEMIAYGCGATVVLTALNLLGVTSGKTTQNVLNVAKLVGLLAIILTAFFLLPAAAPPAESASAEPSEATTETAADKGPADPAAADSSDQAKGDTSSESSKSVRLAILLVLFSYGGWNEVSCVAAEVRDPQKNIFRALAFGVFAVAAVYVLVNFAFLRALGLAGVAGSEAVAADVMALRFGDVGRVGISILICASSLGAMNGALMAGSRILFAVGRDHKQLSWLGGWSGRFDAPIAALVL
ncbi:MAG: amino acid permease, partial [Pirellulaceae bacterium]|nr:amino acid permease [Pirellulaceae bacterium]